MSKLISILILQLFFNKLSSQNIPAFKNDKQCLAYIKKHLDIRDDFTFDSIFNRQEIDSLKPKYTNWQLVDVNNDGKKDLIFVGEYKNIDYEPYTALLCIADKDLNLLLPLLRDKNSQTGFKPHVFIRKIKSQNIIIIHPYYYIGKEKVENLIKEKKLNREYAFGDDSLIYKYNGLINYYQNPSNIKFDSISIIKQYGWSPSNDSVILFSNGIGKYYFGSHRIFHDFVNFDLSKERLLSIKEVVKSIDKNTIPLNSMKARPIKIVLV